MAQRRSRSNFTWIAILVLVVAAFVFFSEGAMDWLRDTLHPRP